MGPRFLATLRDQRGQGFVIRWVKTRFVIACVYLLHELICQALRVPLARRSALGPDLGALAARLRTVVPVHHLPLRTEVLHLGSLVFLTHHDSPSVVLQPCSMSSISRHH